MDDGDHRMLDRGVGADGGKQPALYLEAVILPGDAARHDRGRGGVVVMGDLDRRVDRTREDRRGMGEILHDHRHATTVGAERRTAITGAEAGGARPANDRAVFAFGEQAGAVAAQYDAADHGPVARE